jgi:hypothetical protein
MAKWAKFLQDDNYSGEGEKDTNPCQYCHSQTVNDCLDHCAACGGPREQIEVSKEHRFVDEDAFGAITCSTSAVS